MQDEYDPSLDMTRTDALLDGGAPPPNVLDRTLPIPRSWNTPLSILIVTFLVVSLIWAYWQDYKQGRSQLLD